MILHYSLPILEDNDNALSLLFFSNANTLIGIYSITLPIESQKLKNYYV